MVVELSDKEILFLYGRLKREFSALKANKNIHIPKHDLIFHEELLTKFEAAMPRLKNLSF